MISGIDSSVILDVLSDDPNFADGSEQMLREASNMGQLVLCECVLAEICPALGSQERCHDFLSDWQVDFVPSSQDSAAGEFTVAVFFVEPHPDVTALSESDIVCGPVLHAVIRRYLGLLSGLP